MSSNKRRKTGTGASVGREWTVSVALPGSIVANAQTAELKTYLAGQVARAAVVFNVDEIIVFADRRTPGDRSKSTQGQFQGAVKGASFDADVFLARLLQYLETPQYLRRFLFPVHKDLRYAGLLNPLDCPHHPRATAFMTYREGVVVNKKLQPGEGSHVNVGLPKEVVIDRRVQPNARVTVKLDASTRHQKVLKGVAVAATEPREKLGLYWGYSTRLASGIGAVFDECPYEGGYDLTLGTSERGTNVDDIDHTTLGEHTSGGDRPKHLLIVFGGVAGLEDVVSNDPDLRSKDAQALFDMYLNVCPNQGSNTIRTEEAMLVTLSALRPMLVRLHR